MKKQTLSILLALVLLLSISIFPVFAQELSADEAFSHFGTVDDWGTDDLGLAGVDTAGVDLSTFESKSVSGEADTQELSAKSILEPPSVGPHKVTGDFIPCGDGKVRIVVELKKQPDNYPATGYPGIIYIKKIEVDINGRLTEVKDLMNEYGEKLVDGRLDFPASSDKVKVYGYGVFPEVANALTVSLHVVGTITYKPAPNMPEDTASVEGDALPSATSLCPTAAQTLTNVLKAGMYETCTGKASFKVDIENGTPGYKFLVPADLYIKNKLHTDYTCRYTRFGGSGYPFAGDYCKPGQRIDLRPGEKIRFEAILNTIDLPVADLMSNAALPIDWRFGGHTAMISGSLTPKKGPTESCVAKEKATIVPIPPLASMGTEPIKPSGWYNSYDKAVIGLYQKCGKYAIMQIRLKNTGMKTGFVTLPGAVAINGGAPISFYWASSIVPDKNRIPLAPGAELTLLGRVWMTNVTSQTNSDGPVNVAVNFSDLGLYMTGQLFSDRVNWRCY